MPSHVWTTTTDPPKAVPSWTASASGQRPTFTASNSLPSSPPTPQTRDLCPPTPLLSTSTEPFRLWRTAILPPRLWSEVAAAAAPSRSGGLSLHHVGHRAASKNVSIGQRLNLVSSESVLRPWVPSATTTTTIITTFATEAPPQTPSPNWAPGSIPPKNWIPGCWATCLVQPTVSNDQELSTLATCKMSSLTGLWQQQQQWLDHHHHREWVPLAPSLSSQEFERALKVPPPSPPPWRAPPAALVALPPPLPPLTTTTALAAPWVAATTPARQRAVGRVPTARTPPPQQQPPTRPSSTSGRGSARMLWSRLRRSRPSPRTTTEGRRSWKWWRRIRRIPRTLLRPQGSFPPWRLRTWFSSYIYICVGHTQSRHLLKSLGGECWKRTNSRSTVMIEPCCESQVECRKAFQYIHTGESVYKQQQLVVMLS